MRQDGDSSMSLQSGSAWSYSRYKYNALFPFIPAAILLSIIYTSVPLCMVAKCAYS